MSTVSSSSHSSSFDLPFEKDSENLEKNLTQNNIENLEKLTNEQSLQNNQVQKDPENQTSHSRISNSPVLDSLANFAELNSENSLDKNSSNSLGFGFLDNDKVETRILEEEMQDSYLKYAMSVIVSRALPDVRDGLKPVHRRIIYVLDKMGLTPGAKYRKCAQVVGEVLGKYHPHGDLSVYNALARQAQEFSIRYPLVDGQGNFGSIDGDSPAAMRYTECKMAKPSVYLVGDIDKDTVDFIDNYDGSTLEPKVLPSLFPNLLVNGQTGIAVGMATEVPPHNLTEVCNALVNLIKNPEMTIEDLMEFIKGPDLPTGGILYGKADMLQAYQTGRGKCVLRSKCELLENQIIITEIPYQVNKAETLIKIADMIKDKKIEGVRDIRDESNKEGIRIVIDCKREASSEIILNQLFKMSDLQVNLHFNLLALVNQGRQPKLLNLKEILEEFLIHRGIVVVRRAQFDLKKASEELHILDGLKIALDDIDKVVSLIRSSYDKTEAARKLTTHFGLSPRQIEAILQLRLQTLTNLDKTKIEQNRQKLITLIAELTLILNDSTVRQNLIIAEIEEMSLKLTSPRRTKIISASLNNYDKQDFIAEEEVLIQLTQAQYLKVSSSEEFRQQGRGGRGVSSFNAKDEDYVKNSQIANTHDFVYAFTNNGRVFKTRVFELPSGSRTGRGQNLINYFELKDAEKITNILTISKEDEISGSGSLIFATNFGTVKKTSLDQFSSVNRSGKIAIGLSDGDALVNVCLSQSENDNVVISASNGRTVIFESNQLRAIGRTASGVRGIRIPKTEKVISLQISQFEFQKDEEENVELVEENGAENILESLE
jgi:DNA gyrase subunit A